MAFSRFFDRSYIAAGQSLSICRKDLEMILGERIIALRAGSLCRSDINARWIAEMTINILSRLYPILAISGDKNTCDFLSTIALAVNPAIELREQTHGNLILEIGVETSRNQKSIRPSASGWVAKLAFGHGSDTIGPPNPYSAAVAASFASAEIFRKMFWNYLPKPYRYASSDFSFSLLDHGKETGSSLGLSNHDFGKVVFAGVGAIANPAIWAIARHSGLEGEIWMVDPERIDLGNLERYVLSIDKDADEENDPADYPTKIALGIRELAQSSIKIHFEEKQLEDFADQMGEDFPFDTVCISVDDIEPRRVAQSLLPKLIVNGGTGEGNAGTSWHSFDGLSPCLCCVYHPGDRPKSHIQQVSDSLGIDCETVGKLWVDNIAFSAQDFERIIEHLELTDEQKAQWRDRPIRDFYSGFICGAVKMDLTAAKKAVSVPLAHQSVLAGALMAAELIKRTSAELSEVSQSASIFQCQDVRAPFCEKWINPGIETPVPDCICQDSDYRKVFEEKWRND